MDFIGRAQAMRPYPMESIGLIKFVNLKMRYIIFHKPYGVLSQFTPEGEHSTLKDYIEVPDVYAVGRLDADSEGLLLLTDDGPLQHRLTDPKFRHPRTYWAQVERIPDRAALEQLSSGVTIGNYRTLPAQARLLEPAPELPPRQPPIRERKQIPTAWLELVLIEGKNRQVRKMTAAVGFPTLRLVRTAIGSIPLGNLPLGTWRDLSPTEIAQLKKI
jgi:23S rRNA pseudouridine2457 synthase